MPARSRRVAHCRTCWRWIPQHSRVASRPSVPATTRLRPPGRQASRVVPRKSSCRRAPTRPGAMPRVRSAPKCSSSRTDAPRSLAARQSHAMKAALSFTPSMGRNTVRGTSTLGLEFAGQAARSTYCLIAIGGGGLAAGACSAIKALNPDCHIVGVEPVGSATMHLSFERGTASSIEAPDTIADSLAPPMTLPLPYSLCRETIDEIVLVSDEEIVAAMRLLFEELKLIVEPGGAAATAGLVRVAQRFPRCTLRRHRLRIEHRPGVVLRLAGPSIPVVGAASCREIRHNPWERHLAAKAAVRPHRTQRPRGRLRGRMPLLRRCGYEAEAIASKLSIR